MDDLGIETLGFSEQEIRESAVRELERRRMADFLLSEPFLFHKNLLCPPQKRSFLRKFHEEGLEFVNRTRFKKKIILWPRGHLKTTIFTQGEALRRAIINPNIRILLNSSTYEMAKSFLIAIKGYLQNPEVIEYFGDLIPTSRSGKSYKCNEAELTLTTRSDLTLKEPTFTVSGLDKTKTSQHYDLIIHDDLVMRENVGTFEMLDRTWRIWQDSLDLLEPGGEMILCGTRWHPLDLYGRIVMDHTDERCASRGFEHVENCSCDFDVSILKLRNDDGNFIFDSKFDDHIADELLRQKGRLEFCSQYENNPASPGAVWFPHEKVKESECAPAEIEEMRSKLVWYMAIDPAESVERRSSYTACVGVGVDHDTGIWYVDYAKQARVDTPGFIDLVFSARRIVRPQRFGMEQNTRKSLAYVISDSMAQRNDFFTIEELKPALGNTPHAKEVRVRRLIPLFEHRRIRVNRNLHDLLAAIYTVPAATSWDLLDALSYIMDMVPEALGSANKIENLPVRHMHWNGYSYAVRRFGKRPRRPADLAATAARRAAGPVRPEQLHQALPGSAR